MPKYGIFINFVFCMQLLKKKRKPTENKQKEDKTAVCVVTQFLYVATQKFKQEKETMSQPANLCRSKDKSELKPKKSFLGHDNLEICRDILKVNGEGIVSQHYLSCRNIKAEDYWMNFVLIRDNSVVTENIKKATQVS